MARSATAHRTPRCRDIGVSFGCARGRASRLRCNFDIAAPSDRASDVCAAQASTDAQPHETSDAHCPPPRRGDAPPPRRGDARRGLSFLKSSHKKKTTHAPRDAAAPGGSAVPAHAPQHGMTYLPRRTREHSP